MTAFRPSDAAELRDIVAWAAGEEQPLEIIGAGSKRALGRPMQTEHALDLSALAGIIAYEPKELVLTARAATPLAAIEAALAASGQMLAFEPPDWGGLLGGAGGQTLGGVLSCNLAGPRRFKAGAARDHFLGFHAVSGRGEAFKAGGKVVKNVTGYDLCKLIAGAYGTLAVLSEVSIKVLPRPEEARTVLLLGLADADAVAAMARALGAPHEISGAAHLPASLAARSAVAAVAAAGAAVTALRVEGPGPSVAARCTALRRELAGVAADGELRGGDSDRLWQEVRDADKLRRPAAPVLWRVSLPPAAAPAVAADIARHGPLAHFYDWGGGLLWLGVSGEGDGGAAVIRGALAGCGGHATLIRGPAALRAAIAVFEPQPALAPLSARVKAGFDPRRILNPGRMYLGV